MVQACSFPLLNISRVTRRAFSRFSVLVIGPLLGVSHELKIKLTQVLGQAERLLNAELEKLLLSQCGHGS